MKIFGRRFYWGYYNASEMKLVKNFKMPSLEIKVHTWWDQDIPSTEREMTGYATRRNVVLKAVEVFGHPPNDMVGREVKWDKELMIVRKRPGMLITEMKKDMLVPKDKTIKTSEATVSGSSGPVTGKSRVKSKLSVVQSKVMTKKSSAQSKPLSKNSKVTTSPSSNSIEPTMDSQVSSAKS